MAESSKIEWTDATFNPWEGCQKVGLGCDNCYAEARNSRFGGGTAVNWGPGAPRRRTSPANWRKPLQWNAASFCECRECGWRGETDSNCPGCAAEVRSARRRVFCASLADVFDNQVPREWRADLFRLIRATPKLDWLLLTKRIGNAHEMMVDAIEHELDMGVDHRFDTVPWPNVWIGATVVNQEEADRDIPKLLATPARLHFLSMEPLLGPVSLRRFMGQGFGPAPSWVIVGGESGPGARPMHPDWARSLRDQCAAVGVPFLFKQWGEWLGPMQDGNFDHEPMELNASDEPIRIGKKAAGRKLDGRTHDGFPSGVQGTSGGGR